MITKRDRHYMNLVFAAARDNERDGPRRMSGAKIAALLVFKNTNIVAWGRNQEKTHPLQAQYAKHEEAIYLHAEIDAIRNMLRQLDPDELRHCTMYIARSKYVDDKKRISIYGEAKPCIGCQGAIEAFRIKKVLYTTDDQTIKEF